MSTSQPKKGTSNRSVIVFIVILSFVCAVILSVMASALRKPQEMAMELDRSQQMLIAAKLYSYDGYFILKDKEGRYIPAKYAGDGRLIPGSADDYATQTQILELYQERLAPRLVNDAGDLFTFEEAKIDKDDYIAQYKKVGYYTQAYKLLYEILPNPEAEKGSDKAPIGYVIPVNGYGLWDAIYGYLAVAPDGDTVIGISWYEQKETPGLGANIAEPSWQREFVGKDIFQPSPDGKTDFASAPIGISVVKGKVAEVIGDLPKAKSAVDGIPGATLTGNGVTTAYRDVLGAYRPFFIKLHKEYKER